MIPHARTETGKLVLSRSEISDEMRRINASQDRMLNKRLGAIDRQERTAQATHKKTINKATGGQDPKVLQTRRPTIEPTAGSLDLAQYEAMKEARARGQSPRSLALQLTPIEGAAVAGHQSKASSPVWRGQRFVSQNSSTDASGEGEGRETKVQWTSEDNSPG